MIAGGKEYESNYVISSLPLRNVVGMADPHPKPELASAAKGIRYRDFLTVSLVLDGEDLFPDNWIYIHDPRSTSAGSRTSAPGAPGWFRTRPRPVWASSSSASPATSCGRWTTTSSIDLGMRELEQLGLAKKDQFNFGFVTRVPKAYPMYDADYAERVAAIRGWLDGIENLQQVGRNGLHRYNNSDHSMLTAMRAVDNLVKGTDHDIWAVNAESVYHETEEQDEQQPYIEAPETEAQKEPLHH